ncbi:PAS domain-containing sensor histidine kinase [Halalkalibacter okhensis]|uniref:histidine kinase n=1 Tax=Halalkalibacter okhensis TaxID=333138 RepID=A0A0B0IN56_9BACI|nr:PAS domain-containing sensor histidine kinase [Halalkalibacter okhensis]KHF41111.1 histidine kinase [Halalkalibacter okhensis]
MHKKRKILLYIILGIIWIIFTDLIVAQLNSDLHVYILIQQIKGFIFVILSGFFIYYAFVKKAENQAVKAEKEKLETLINSMVDFVNFKDGQGRWTQANEFALKLFQIEHVDYVGKKDTDLAEYSEFYREAFYYCEASDEEAWQVGKVSRCIEQIPTPDGTTKTFDTIKVPIFHQDGSRKELVVMGRDITDQVQVEKKLEKSRQNYRSLVEFNPELVFILNREGHVLELNPQFKSMTGYEAKEFLGKSILSLIEKNSKRLAIQAFNRILKDQTNWVNQEITVMHKDGSQRVFRCTAVPTIINNEVLGAIGYAMDVTKEKETEERLRKTEKLSVVGELAASVAHEIRNPLTSIKGFIQFMNSNDTKNQSYYTIMLDELERINQISSELLALGKPREVQFEKCDINQIFASVMWLLESQANLYNVRIHYNRNHSLAHIECEPNQLKQLFINIIKNSIEAESKTIQIHVSEKMNQLQIRIHDDGNGIDEDRMDRLGEPFYSSKEKGTGLGLAVSYRIIQAHHGNIHFDSKLKEGTTVTIDLPTTQ